MKYFVYCWEYFRLTWIPTEPHVKVAIGISRITEVMSRVETNSIRVSF
jgi:hypothetical protein